MSTDKDDINSANINKILAEIKSSSYYKPQKTKIIAVSKKQPLSKITAAYEFGFKDFGENYVQEAKTKAEILPNDIKWHLIGPLQKNKVKYCPAVFEVIHSLSDIKVAAEIQKRYLKAQKTVDCLLQMNLNEEKTKNGIINMDELYKFADKIVNFSQLKIVGLMTIPDPNLNDYQTSQTYAKLREYKELLSIHLGNLAQITELSMGMTKDYMLALKEGATYLRIGSAFFGQRL